MITNTDVVAAVEAHLARYPQHRARLAHILWLLEEGGQLCDRGSFPVHVTVGALLVDTDGNVVVVGHLAHRVTLQPGGHCDPDDASLAGGALRELCEEAGVDPGAVRLACEYPVYVEHGYAPARPDRGEPAHDHIDVGFMFTPVGARPLLTPQLTEVAYAEWRPTEAVRAVLSDVVATALTEALPGRDLVSCAPPEHGSPARPVLADLRRLLGIGADGQPTLKARQAIALIRHPHTPWYAGENAEDRLGALLTCPLALNLCGTRWEGLLARELTGRSPGPKGSDVCLAERARRMGTGIEELIGALAPLLDLFEEGVELSAYTAGHVQILLPEFYEHAELWSSILVNDYEEDSSPEDDEARATRGVLAWFADDRLPHAGQARRIGQFCEARALLAADGSSPFVGGLPYEESPSQGWPAWTDTVVEHLAQVYREHCAGQVEHRPRIESAPRQPASIAARGLRSQVPVALADLLEAYGDEHAEAGSQHPGVALVRYLRSGSRYWHMQGTYSQLYDALLSVARGITSTPLLTSSRAALLAQHVHDYLYIGYPSVYDPVQLQEVEDLPLSGWEARRLFPEITDLVALLPAALAGSAPPYEAPSWGVAPVLGSFARTRPPAPAGLAPLVGEIAELLALACDETDLTHAMAHLAGGTAPRPPRSWRMWLTDLSVAARAMMDRAVLQQAESFSAGARPHSAVRTAPRLSGPDGNGASFTLPGRDEIERRLAGDAAPASLGIFASRLLALAGRTLTVQSLITALTLTLADYAKGEAELTRVGNWAVPNVIDLIIDDTQARADLHTYWQAVHPR